MTNIKLIKFLPRYGSEDGIGMDEVPLMLSDDGFETDENDYLMDASRGRRSGGRGLSYYLCDGWKNACSR